MSGRSNTSDRRGWTMSTTTEFHDPRAQPKAVAEPYEIRVDLDAPLTIGLVANGFPDSVRFWITLKKPLRKQFLQLRSFGTTKVMHLQSSAEKCSKTSRLSVRRS